MFFVTAIFAFISVGRALSYQVIKTAPVIEAAIIASVCIQNGQRSSLRVCKASRTQVVD